MRIDNWIGLDASRSASVSGSAANVARTPSALFAQSLERAQEDRSIRLPADWVELSEGSGSVMNLPLNANGVYDKATKAALGKIDEDYRKALPVFGGEVFLPPVENYDPRIELLRLARVELKVAAMEEEGVFDELVDAYIGIHGLKDKLTPDQKQELKARLIDVSKAVLLENEWERAYPGAMKSRIDVSIDALRDYLQSPDRSIRRKPIDASLPAGDPDLLGFLESPRWEAFRPDPAAIAERARQIRERH